MSMLSAQCDKLRAMAERLDWELPETAMLLREAADTIWELHCKLNNEWDENDKLREELSQWERLTANIELPEYPVTEFQPKDLERENAKLRELVVALYHIHFGSEEESWDAWEDFCPCDICEERHGGEAPCAHTAKDMADDCCDPITKEIVTNRMRELGVDE